MVQEHLPPGVLSRPRVQRCVLCCRGGVGCVWLTKPETLSVACYHEGQGQCCNSLKNQTSAFFSSFHAREENSHLSTNRQDCSVGKVWQASVFLPWNSLQNTLEKPFCLSLQGQREYCSPLYQGTEFTVLALCGRQEHSFPASFNSQKERELSAYLQAFLPCFSFHGQRREYEYRQECSFLASSNIQEKKRVLSTQLSRDRTTGNAFPVSSSWPEKASSLLSKKVTEEGLLCGRVLWFYSG